VLKMEERATDQGVIVSYRRWIRQRNRLSLRTLGKLLAP
jgi:hypothetical protein